jgi:hypothetical protein
MENKIIEKTKQSLSFVEQLRNQIQTCRDALCNPEIAFTPTVDTLEILLWPKLLKDLEYKSKISEIEKVYDSQIKDLENNEINKGFYPNKEKIEFESIKFQRKMAQEKFKAIMVFIDKKGYMPLGEQDE